MVNLAMNKNGYGKISQGTNGHMEKWYWHNNGHGMFGQGISDRIIK